MVQKKYLDDYRSVWSEKQYSSQAAKIDYLLSYLTELDGLDGQQQTLASVSTAQARSYKEHLQKAPSNAKKKYPGLSPQAAVDAAAADHAQFRNFLEGSGIQLTRPNTTKLSGAQLGQRITESTVHLSCLMTMAQIEEVRDQKVLFTEFD